MTAPLSRRSVLRSTAAAGVAAPLLVACGSDAESDTSAPASTTPSASDSPTASATKGGGGGSAPTELVATSEVPVGGGVILKDNAVVVTQPSEGDFKAFTAVCTHTGCIVSSVSEGKIVCGCHGSQYSIEDGSVIQGPAPAALTPLEVAVKGGEVVQS